MLAALFLLLPLMAGCAHDTGHPTVVATAPPPPKLAVPREDVPGLTNFARVSNVLYRGAQPDKGGFAELKRMGVRTIVDLRSSHDDTSQLTGLGLQYAYIPQNAWSVDEDDVARFLKIVEDPKNQPVFVHCAQGADRTGFAVAAYRIMDEGWSNESAVAELSQFQYHAIFFGITDQLLKINPGELKSRVAALPPQPVRVVP